MLKKIKLRLSAGVLFLGCLAATSAFGQSSRSYSDTWADTPAEETETNFTYTGESSRIYIMGAGAVEINPNSQAHEANMQVEIRSPQGRTEYGGAARHQGSSGTSMTVAVSLDFIRDIEDAGNYVTAAGFLEVCPYQPGTIFSAASIAVSIKREVYKFLSSFPAGGRFGHGYCEYDNYCPFGQGICGLSYFSVDRLTANAACPADLQCRTLYVRGVCLNRGKVCTSLIGQGVCDYN